MAGMFGAGLMQGLAGGLEQGMRRRGLRDRMMGGGQQPMMGRPMQVETEPGDVPVGYQLDEQQFMPSAQPNFLQHLLSMFGG